MSKKEEIIKALRRVLTSDGTPVFFPGQHKGECKKEYIVIKYDGAVDLEFVSSERPIYTIMCYVPENNYSRLESFVFETKQKMKRCFPLVMYGGNETPSYYDDGVKAHMISFQYLGVRKISNR